MKKQIMIGDIVRAREFQLRKLDPEYVEELAEAYTAKAEIPCPRVWLVKGRPNHFLTRGFHRIAGAEKAGLRRLECEVKNGTAEEAFADALSGDVGNGRRMTNKEKRAAVKKAVKEYPEWSDRKVAELIGVSHPLVAEVRSESGNSSTRAKKERKTKDKLAESHKALKAVVKTLPTADGVDKWLTEVTEWAKEIAGSLRGQRTFL